MKFKAFWNTKLYEEIELVENRIEFLKKNHTEIDTSHDSLAQHKDAHSIIDHFANHADPTKNKQYTQWIINRYKERNFRQEDAPRVKTALTNFDKHKGKLEKKDINQYKTLTHVEDAVEPHLGEKSKKEEKREIKHEGAELIHSENGITVHKLKTKKAACHYGAGTKWCTAAKNSDNMFDRYNKQGPLYVVQHKPSGRKWQFHFESGQFMDEKDEPVDLKKLVSDHPQLKNVKEFKEKDSPHAVHFMEPEEKKKHFDKLTDPKRLKEIRLWYPGQIYHKHIQSIVNHGDAEHVENAVKHLEHSYHQEHLYEAIYEKEHIENAAQRTFSESDPSFKRLREYFLKNYGKKDNAPKFDKVRNIIAEKGNKEERLDLMQRNPNDKLLHIAVLKNNPDHEHIEFVKNHPDERHRRYVADNQPDSNVYHKIMGHPK